MALIIIRGDVVAGLEFVGPFEALREAMEWIQSNITDETERCQTVELISPTAEQEDWGDATKIGHLP